ncbi:DUF2586 family protein [Spongiimicrobium salis]|uniref:DUF2586 family protein n=1 Tax=Spongiimicrobium salis TaxID=1667022 RepID=UPI00374D93D8
MARPGLTIEKGNGGLGRRQPSQRMISGAVMQAVATPKMTLGEIYELRGTADANALELNAEYDSSNKVLVHHHIERFFLRNPSGTLHFMPVAQNVAMADIVDKDQEYLEKLLRTKAGEIRQAMVALNPDATYVPTIEDGLDSDVLAAIPVAQQLADHEFSKDRFAHIFLEGRSLTGTTSALRDLRDLAADAADVSVVIAADNDISASDPRYAGYAAIGDVLGLVSSAFVGQNAGELTQGFNLTDVAETAFISAGLSSGNPIDSYNDTDLDALNEKGYIFATSVSGIAGYFLVDMHTCSDIEGDYAYVENVRTINEMIRAARAALLPRVKGRLFVDPDSGKLAPNTIKEMEASTIASQDQLVADGDLSGGVECYIDPDQNVLSTSRLEVSLSAVPVAIGRQINLKIGFNNPSNT